MKAWRTLASASLAMAVLVACNTPTIPLPPPQPEPEDVVVTRYQLDDTKLVLEADSESRASSFPPGAVVTIFDRDSGYGTVVTADGNGEFVSDPFTGQEGDVVFISYVDEEGAESDELCVLVRLGRQGDGDLCP